MDIMKYQKEDYENYIKKLRKFKEIKWIKNHLYLKSKPNFWTILEYGEENSSRDRSAHETRSSRMLRWLLDANETHNLGNAFAHKLVQHIGGNYDYSPEKNKKISSTAEYKDIDVFYVDHAQKICVAIELKQFAKEGKSRGFKSQLDKYESIVENWIKKQKEPYTPYYIFLTPLKDKPSNDKWLPVGYKEFIAIIDDVTEQYINKSQDRYIVDTKKIVSDFRDDLQRSVDLLEKDNSEIKNALTPEERQLTIDLAKEIEHGTDTKYVEKLNEIDNDPLNKDIILVIKDYLNVQNKAPNSAVRILMRKIHRYLSGGIELDPDLGTEYHWKDTVAPLKKQLIEKYNLQFDRIQLTQRNSQGIYLFHKSGKYKIYFSGDTYGDFPNHNVQLLEEAKPGNILLGVSKHMPINQFKAEDKLIEKDKISFKDGKDIDLKTFMEDHVLVAIKELNDKLIEEILKK